jgi:hypothetical protein
MSVLIFNITQPQEDVNMEEDEGNAQEQEREQEQENGEHLLFLLPLKWVC